MRNIPLPFLALILFCGLATRFELAEVNLVSPADDADAVPVAPTFSWVAVDGSESYELEVATKRNMRQPVIEMSGIAGTSTGPADLLNETTTYFWRARAVDAQGPGPWSSVWSFKTGSLPGAVALTQPVDQSIGVDLTPDFTWSSANGADSYDLEVSTSAQFASIAFSQSDILGTNFEPSNNLEVQTRYYWRVRASNSIGDGEFSSTSWFETLAASPSQVTLEAPVDGATGVQTSLTFSWAAADAAESYRIEVSESPDLSTALIDESGISTTTFTVPNPLQNGAVLYWRVRATNSLGDGPLSPVYSFTTAVGGPTQVSLTSPPDGTDDVELTPTLAWQAVDGATDYRVQVATQADFAGGLIHDTVVGHTQFQTSTLSLGETYFWRVRASNAGVENWSEVSSFSTGASAPAQIVLVSPPDGAVDQSLTPELVWAASDLAASYNLEIGLDGAFSVILASETGLLDTRLALENLDHSTQYFWRVRGVNAAGAGPWSSVRSFTTEIVFAPAAPQLIYPPDGADGIVDNPVFSWNESQGADSYKLELSTSPPDELENFVTVVTAVVVSQPFFQSPDLSVGKLHYWRVEARNEGGSARSEVRTFTTAPVTASESDVLPDAFSLEQNYPNPFNPSTRIEYALSGAGMVRLAVSDITGRHVATIVSSEQPAGRYEVIWDGRSDDGSVVASGVYLYRLSTPLYSQVMRMVVAK